jgi:acyl-CoA reductase-like NAD-dependent aldehyde dehydrogenase
MIFGTDIGAELVRHPAIQAVGFTGSLTGGKRYSSWRSSARSQSRCLRKCRRLIR